MRVCRRVLGLLVIVLCILGVDCGAGNGGRFLARGARPGFWFLLLVLLSLSLASAKRLRSARVAPVRGGTYFLCRRVTIQRL